MTSLGSRLGAFAFELLYFGAMAPFAAISAPFSFRSRRAIRALIRVMGFARFRPPPRIASPSVPPSSLPLLGPGLDLLNPEGDDFNVSNYELAILCSLTGQLKPRTILEFGTYSGRTTLNLAHRAPEAAVFTLDLSDRAEPGLHAHERIHQILGDSVEFDHQSFVSEHGVVDLVFIDGGHEPNVVRSDSIKARDVLADGGYVVWHDYTRLDGVQTTVDSMVAEDLFPGVVHIQGTTLAVWSESLPRSSRSA